MKRFAVVIGLGCALVLILAGCTATTGSPSSGVNSVGGTAPAESSAPSNPDAGGSGASSSSGATLDGNPIVGTWLLAEVGGPGKWEKPQPYDAGTTVEFHPDGQAIYSGHIGTWQPLDGSRLRMDISGSYAVPYTLDGDTLTLTNPPMTSGTLKFTRQ